MILTSIGITLITMMAFTGAIAFKPTIRLGHREVQLFWIIPLIGALLLIIFGVIPVNLDHPQSLWRALTSDSKINPLEILTLFIAISFLSIVLDEAGFFKLMANFALTRAGFSQKKLFFSLYFTIALLTIFTSNDIVILTFTPFIAYFSKRAKINPLPYLIADFVSANTWSLLLVIGNPTNIFLATTYEINFISYFLTLAIPTIALSLTAMGITYWLFRKDLKLPLVHQEDAIKIKTMPALMVVGLIHLFGTTILLAISSWIQLEMWFICLIAALSMSAFTIGYSLYQKQPIILTVGKRLPWTLIPFVLSMFTIVYGLELTGVSAQIGHWLDTTLPATPLITALQYGVLSTLGANVLNNIPMSVAFSTIIASSSQQPAALYATIIGSNLGAILTPVGALAGIMWMEILKKAEIKFNFSKFIAFGWIIMLPSLLIGLLLLPLFL